MSGLHEYGKGHWFISLVWSQLTIDTLMQSTDFVWIRISGVWKSGTFVLKILLSKVNLLLSVKNHADNIWNQLPIYNAACWNGRICGRIFFERNRWKQAAKIKKATRIYSIFFTWLHWSISMNNMSYCSFTK